MHPVKGEGESRRVEAWGATRFSLDTHRLLYNHGAQNGREICFAGKI